MSAYETLGVDQNASQDDNKKAYRNLAKKWHPDTNKSPDATRKFQEIASAYDVLSDPEKRKRYNMTKGSVFGDSTNMSRDQAQQIFRTFFGGTQAAQEQFGGVGTFFNVFQNKRSRPSPYVLECTLEQIARRAVRKLKVKRQRLDKGDGVTDENIICVNLEPQWKTGTKITFPTGGDVSRAGRPTAIVIEIKVLDHPLYARDKDDLHVHLRVPLKESLCTGFHTTLTGVMGETIEINESFIPFGHTAIMPGHGMPRRQSRGGLIVHYDVIFPYLSQCEKDAIAKIL